MELKRNFSLKKYNTFGIDAKAKLFVAPKNVEELKQILQNPILKAEPKLIIGGGSNMLFVSDFDGLVILPDLKGISFLEFIDSEVIVKAGAGENWDTFVEWTINQSYGGIENLSLIPGTVGASPVQNIGAYGVEVGDLIERVEAIDINTGNFREFTKMECEFAYRNSVFKQKYKNQFIVTSVYFKLSLKPIFNINYGAVKDELEKLGDINLRNIRQAIIDIRQSKLPDPEIIPNAGSFFKNPVISKQQADILLSKYPEMVYYNNVDSSVKLAAGWLIEHLGWKGKSYKGAGVHEKQALVLVNRSNASGKEIIELAEKIRASVIDEFGVELEFEVIVV